MSPNTPHHDLIIWQEAHELVLSVYQITKRFPADERYCLTSQLRRASVSVAANIAEGKGRSSGKDFVRFLAMAKGSLNESQYYCQLSGDLGYINRQSADSLVQRYQILSNSIESLVCSINRRIFSSVGNRTSSKSKACSGSK